MNMIHLHFQDGFQDDEIVVSAGSRELWRGAGISTDLRISRARVAEIEIEEPQSELRIALPKRGISTLISVDAAAAPFVGVSVGSSRELEIRFSPSDFDYF